MLRTILLVVSFAAGWFCPALALLKPLMPWCLVYMLTVVFVRMDFTPRALTGRHWLVVGMNVLTAFLVWGGLLLAGVPERFAQAAFFTTITPTASAAPVIISLLGGSITFGSMGFLLSALVVSAVLPVAVPLVFHQSAWSVMPMILFRVGVVTLLPLLVAMGLRRRFGERARTFGQRLTPSTLYAWITLVAIIAASASDFLRNCPFPQSDVLWVMGLDLALCVVLFAFGARLGGRNHRRECSQLLGQKNTSYTTYLAFACGEPFAALGPAFYVFFHNAWNGIQLIFHKEPPHEPPPPASH